MMPKPSKSSQVSSGDGKEKPTSSSLARWLTPVSSKSPSRAKSPSNSSTSRQGKTSSRKPEKLKAERLKPEHKEESDNSEPDSEVEDESDEFDVEGEDNSFDSRVQEQILNFFQESSVDELSLISGCSLKKAQKIISLRPFNTWKDVVRVF